MKDDYYKVWFEKNVWDSSSWLKSARDLLASTNYLKPHLVEEWKNTEKLPEIHGVYLMLSGFVIENILKLIIIKNQINADTNKDKIPNIINTHNLYKLCNAAGIKFQDKEKDLVKRVSEFVIWGGRYPAPYNFEGLKPVETEYGHKRMSLSFHPNDIRELECFIKYLAYKTNDSDFCASIDMSISSKKPENWETSMQSDITTVYLP